MAKGGSEGKQQKEGLVVCEERWQWAAIDAGGMGMSQ